jgi:hypothetical protein
MADERLELLKALDFGRVDAESEFDLDQRFVRTADFERFVEPDVQLVLGAKGTGKSAIFDLFARFEETARREAGDQVRDVVVVTGTGMGDLYEVRTGDLEEMKPGEGYEEMWRLYIAVKVAFAIEDLARNTNGSVSELLRVAGKLPDRRLGPLVKQLWTLLVSARAPGSIGVVGISLADFESGKLDVTQLLFDADQLLARHGKRAWVLFDKVDELFPSNPPERQLAIEGPLSTSMSMRRTFPQIQPRVFLRTDIWSDVNLTNKTHLVDKTVTLSWSRDGLAQLLVKGAGTQEGIREYLMSTTSVDPRSVEAHQSADVEALLLRLLPPTAYPGEREAGIVDWIHARVQDSRGTAFPRETILLGNRSRDAQVRRGAAASEGDSGALIGREAVREAFAQVSELRCSTYLAEFPALRAHFRRFEGKTTAEFTRAEVEAMMNGLTPAGVDMFRALHEVGVLKPADGNESTATRFEVPRLYRQGLGLVIRGRP